jgi:hypothetical protein
MRLPYEVWFKPTAADVFNEAPTLLGRYETDYLAKRCAGLIRACVTAGDVEVEFNDNAPEAS